MAVVEKKWTYEDYQKLDDGQRYEVHEGALLYMAPAPSVNHQKVSGELYLLIRQFLKNKKTGELLAAPCDVILGENNVVQPDLIFIAAKNRAVMRDAGIFGVPDMVVEIISPSSHYRDSYEKKNLYEKFGVPEFWLVDPANKVIEVFTIKNGAYDLFSMASISGQVRSSVMEGLTIEIADVIPSY